MFANKDIVVKRPAVRPPNGTRPASSPHPSRGGNAYSPEVRDQVIVMWQNGTLENNPTIIQLRMQHKFPCLRICSRWIRQFQAEGNTRAKRRTGNRHSLREVNGQDLVNLALYRAIRPKAYIDEVRAYVHNRNPANPPYSLSQIVRAEQRLGLFQKVGSTTSDCAYIPLNQFKHDQYWGAAYPDGVMGESTRDVIDLDESCFKLESQNRKYGKVTRQRRCDARGKYRKGAGTISLLMAISGDERVGEAFSFHRTYTEGGTNQWRFYNYMLELCDWLDMNRNGRSFLFTMDNLNLHKHPMIINMIHSRGHRVVYRAPYWSCDGAIEYVFNTIQTNLQVDVNGVGSVYQLVNKINTIIAHMPHFKRYFIHVGFANN